MFISYSPSNVLLPKPVLFHRQLSTESVIYADNVFILLKTKKFSSNNNYANTIALLRLVQYRAAASKLFTAKQNIRRKKDMDCIKGLTVSKLFQGRNVSLRADWKAHAGKEIRKAVLGSSSTKTCFCRCCLIPMLSSKHTDVKVPGFTAILDVTGVTVSVDFMSTKRTKQHSKGDHKLR